MCGRKVLFSLAIACFLGAVLIGLSLSQAQQAPGERMRARGEPNAPRDPEQMQRMMTERQIARIKETLQPSAEEWKVLEPKVTKVITLSRQTGGMGGMGMFSRRPGGQGPQMPRDQTQVGKSLEELQKILDNKEAKPEEIKAKLTALRDARDKAKKELAKAQQELRQGMSPRQEAQLVLIGLLE
jgi:predicted RNase H-like nuclease (RuvC/YqgF family)